MLHLNYTRALSQSESSNFFMCIIILGICENNIEYQGFTLQYMKGDWKKKIKHWLFSELNFEDIIAAIDVIRCILAI